MNVLLTERVSVAKKPDGKKPPVASNRFEMRLDPAWLERVERQAERLGMSAAAYIRQATSIRLEADEATDPRIASSDS